MNILYESAEFYHEQSKSGKYMSSHLLADFRRSPLLYHKTILGQIDEKPSSAYSLGTAAHKLILEGPQAFNAEYLVSDGPINPKTGEAYGKTSKAYLEWFAQQDRLVLSPEDFGLIAKMYDGVKQHPIAEKLLHNGEPEGVLRADIEGVPCQIRMDWFGPAGLVDLKTCAELRYFEHDIKRFGYVAQLAFYRAVIKAVLGIDVPVHILAVEKCEPYAAAVWQVSPNSLDEAHEINVAALRFFKECLVTNSWPTGWEHLKVI